MKNVTCRKLIIDRSKVPEKLGTLKDISLYGSFVSIFWWVGCQIIGRDWKRAEEDPRTTPILSNRSCQIAGSTGAATTDDIPFPSNNITQQNQHQTNYSVNVVQHASEQQQPSANGFRPVNQIQQNLPKAGSALKTGGGKCTVFTLILAIL